MALSWFKTYLSDQFQFIHINSQAFMYAKKKNEVNPVTKHTKRVHTFVTSRLRYCDSL